mmetsp:Transcript_80063/g.166515  ORF Transcript_80063/g.166515 Transcript_80063/m.166515 type:complete len:573 (-) Transcript_80063:127-1845(-)
MSCDKCVCDAGDKPIEDLVHDTNFTYQPMFEHAVAVDIPYKKNEALSKGVSSSTVTLQSGETRELLHVEPWVLTRLSELCITEIEHFLRPGHLAQLAKILEDPEASDNDRFSARNLLQNAVVAAEKTLPGCQDTGTAIVMGKRGQNVLTNQDDEMQLSRGVYEAFTKSNLRFSQVSPISMFHDVNTKNNLPAQVDIYGTKGNEYKFMFMAKGGGSANKTYLYQQTKALLNPKKLEAFIKEKVQTLGTSACPPYHVALVIGGTSAETCLKTVKLASARYYDDLPTTGNEHGRAFRDLEWEAKVLKICQDLQVGAQFGGKYFAHDARVIRLPRHGASCPVGLGVSCSADRQIVAKINAEGVFVEELEHNPARFLEQATSPSAGPSPAPAEAVVKIDLNQPMADILACLSQYPIKTRVSLTGPLIVARDIAHAKLNERLEETGDLPDYVKNHPIYYAGPAKTPDGMASGSFGPTTAGRMDSYVPIFQKHRASLVTLAKGNRSKQVTESCQENGGFYLGSIGGAAAVLASDNIKKVEVVEYEDLGMEAIWKIEVEDFPAFILVDDKGNDFFAKWSM